MARKSRRLPRRRLRQHGGNEELFNAAKQGNLARVSELLATPGVNVNYKKAEPGDFFPLFAAAENGHADIVQALIDAGANVNLKRFNGTTALITAARAGHLNIVQILLNVPGIDLNASGAGGMSALLTAAANGYVEIVRLLIQKGANINDKNNAGMSVLHLACHWGYNDVVKALLESQAVNVNYATIFHNETPLYLAAKKGFAEVVRTLMDDPRTVVDQKTLEAADNGEFSAEIQEMVDKAPYNLANATNLNVPFNAMNAISYAPIHNGNTLIDFDGEAGYQRYYTPESFSILQFNPLSREPINKATIKPHRASIRRQIPAGTANALTGEAIQDGNVMANYFGEADAGRFYKRATFNSQIAPHAAEIKNPEDNTESLDPEMHARYYRASVAPMIVRGGRHSRRRHVRRHKHTRRH
jgi:ankyrin repeat protein